MFHQFIFTVQNSQPANPTVAKLLEVDAQLAAQEVELKAQIQSIGEKRHSLKTVIDMFAPVHTTDTVPVARPTPTAEEQPQPTTPGVAVPELNGALTDTTESVVLASQQHQLQQAKKNSSTNTRQSKKSAPNGTKLTESVSSKTLVAKDLTMFHHQGVSFGATFSHSRLTSFSTFWY